MGGPRIENIFVKVIFGWGLLAAMVTEVPINQGGVFVGAYRYRIIQMNILIC